MKIKKSKIVIGFGLLLTILTSHSQTPGPLEITPSNSGSTILIGRKDGNPSIKSSQLGTGHLILDSQSSKYVSLNHYTSDNVVLAYGGGKVGVGVNNPNSPFVIGYNDGVNQLALQRSDGKETFLMHINSNNQITFKNKTGSGDYDFQTNIAGQNMASALFIEGTNGNIGIGTTVPDTKLAVNGVIHSKEVKVDLVGWPDYVFKNNYQLPTLKEVENHITEKGHLRGIPSAKEVKENGINLGEMNAKLLQKIEELTLYALEQEKKLNTQNKVITKQQQEIQSLKLLEQRLDKIEESIKHLQK